MRTTLTLDPDVARMLDEAVHRERRSFKAVVNDAIRRGLGGGAPLRDTKHLRLRPHKARLRPGLDPSGFNRLAGELEDAAVLRKALRATS